MNKMLYINVNSLGLNPEVVKRLNQSNIKILDDFNKYSLEELELFLGDMFSQIKSILIYYKLPRSINKLTKSKELVFLLENHGISDLLTLVKYSKFLLYQILKDDQSLLDETNKILELYGKERVTDRFKNKSNNKNIQIKETSEIIIIDTNKNKNFSSKQSIKTDKKKYVTTHSTGKPSDLEFFKPRIIRQDINNDSPIDTNEIKIQEVKVTKNNGETINTKKNQLPKSSNIIWVDIDNEKRGNRLNKTNKPSDIAKNQMKKPEKKNDILVLKNTSKVKKTFQSKNLSEEKVQLNKQSKQVLSLPVDYLKLSQTAFDRLKLSGISRLEDFNTFNLKELQMLLGDSFNEVLPTLIYYKLPRDVRDLSLSDEVVSVLETVGIKDLEALIKYDKSILYHVFKDDEFLLNEISNLLKFYEEEPLIVETSETDNNKIPIDTYSNFSKKEISEILSIPVEKLKITKETYDMLKASSIEILGHINRFNLIDIQFMMGNLFEDLLPILAYYKMPRELDKLSLKSEATSILDKAGIRNTKTLLMHDLEILRDIFKNNENLLYEVQQIVEIYNNYKDIDESSIIVKYNSSNVNSNDSRGILDVLYKLYPEFRIKQDIKDLNNIFKEGILVMGWEEFTRIIYNQSEINKQLNLKPFNDYIQNKFNEFRRFHIVNRLFLTVPETNYVFKEDKRTYFDRMYDFFTNTTIFFIDYKDRLRLDLSKKAMMKLIEQLTFKTVSNERMDEIYLDRIQTYYEEYQNVNSSAISNLIHSKNEVLYFMNSVQENKLLFKQSIDLLDTYQTLNVAIEGLHSDNNQMLLDKILPASLCELLKEKDIKTLDDIKQTNIKEILQPEEIKVYFDVLYNVILDFNKSYKDEIYDLLYELSDNLTEKESFVLMNRAKNRTLQELGAKLGVTRERVRQIESKQYRKLSTSKAKSHIVRILKSVLGEVSIITKEQIDEIGKDLDWLFDTLMKNYWNRSIKGYLLDSNDHEVLKLKYSELEEHYSIEDLEYANLDEVSRLLIDSKYHRLGKHYFKKKSTKPVEYKIIIEKYFNEGLHIYNQKHIEKFKRHYQYEYETNELEDMSERAFSGRIVEVKGLVPVDRGFYKMQAYELPQDLVEKLRADILKSQSLMISTLYAQNKKDLRKASIENRYQLHGVLNKYLSEFHLNRDMISVSQNHQTSSTEILDVLFQWEPSVISISDIKKSIPGITDIVLYSYLNNRGNYLSMENGILKHIREFTLNQTDQHEIRLKIYNMLKLRGFITVDALYDEIIGYEFYHIIEQNQITNKRVMYNFIQYFYKDQFQFTKFTILPLGEEYVSVENRIINIVKQHNKIPIKDLMEQIEKNGFKINSKQNILLLTYKQGYFRIDDNTIVKKELLQFPDDLIERVENLLIDSMLGNKITTNQITNFNHFPNINIPWNKHILGNLMINFSKKIKVKDISKSYLDVEFEFKEKNK